jgi:hypothetical protein
MMLIRIVFYAVLMSIGGILHGARMCRCCG